MSTVRTTRPKLKKVNKLISSASFTTTKMRRAAAGEQSKISLRKSRPTPNKPTTGIPPRLWSHLIPPMPLIAQTIYRHYKKGPPAESWSLSFDLAIAIISDFLQRSTTKTVEELQSITTVKGIPIPAGINREKAWIPQEFRQKAGKQLEKLFSLKDERAIGWDWRSDRDQAPELRGEWLESRQQSSEKKRTILYLHGGAYYLCSYAMYRQFLSKLAKLSDARVFSIDYRLAPQHPFPAAVEDALAAYMYLTESPNNIDPSTIVVAGDSAGGGLTFALLLALRDAGLQAPAGAMTLSPWLDLTHSLPSIVSNVLTDYLPAVGFKHAPSAAIDYNRLPRPKSELLKEAASPAAFGRPSSSSSRSVLHHEDDIDRVQFYADNRVLKHPFVSPIFDKHRLRGLPKLLVQAGTAERLRDESIYLALAASNQCKEELKDDDYRPTNVQLELFVDQPHVFQLILPTAASVRAVQNLSNFVRHATNTDSSTTEQQQQQQQSTSDTLSVNTITPKGNIVETTQELLDKFKDGTRWKEWEERLARPSLKARIVDVEAAVSRLLKTSSDK